MQSVENGDNANGLASRLNTRTCNTTQKQGRRHVRGFDSTLQIQYIFGSKSRYYFITLNTFQKEKQKQKFI